MVVRSAKDEDSDVAALPRVTAVEDEIKGGVGDGSSCSDGLVVGEDNDLGCDGGVQGWRKIRQQWWSRTTHTAVQRQQLRTMQAG
jgi:hypothetical protein